MRLASFIVSSILIGPALVPGVARGVPELYESACASCHVDDTPTCAGCHNHHLELVATPDALVHRPGEPISVALSGALLPGWIRAVLYDDAGTELDRVTGPTGTGDDGTGPAVADSIVVPAVLTATAPLEPGTYTWRAAYYGVFNIQDVTHQEQWVSVAITVADTSRVTVGTTWGGVKGLYDEPSPRRPRGTRRE